MSESQKRVQEAVDEIQGWLARDPAPNEAIVRQAIVLRLLLASGFNIWNPLEIVPEETNSGGTRPDLLIKADSGGFALEIKGASVSFQPKDYQQVTAYAGSIGLRWAMLTNGRVWSVIDERLTGPYRDRELFRIELSNNNTQDFARDIHDLLNAKTWREDAFGTVAHELGDRLRRRQDNRKILTEKKPIVETFRLENDIGSFEKAADLATKLGLITLNEKQILLGTNDSLNERPKIIQFRYEVYGAIARAVYRPDAETWTVLSGSTALNRTMVLTDNGIHKRRRRYLAEGRLRQRDDEFLEYVHDIVYLSPTTAAQDIVGGPRNGWECWRDENGQLADVYRDLKKHPKILRPNRAKKIKDTDST
jgi:predicted type IV restriction endonuclease